MTAPAREARSARTPRRRPVGATLLAGLLAVGLTAVGALAVAVPASGGQPTPAAASAAASDAGPAPAAAKVRTVTYDGFGVSVRRAKHQLGRLSDTSADFRRAMRGNLDDLWGYTDDDPACASAPVIVVKRWRSDGWATLSDEGVFKPCPQGGNAAIWRSVDGAWREVLGTQEAPRCSKLRRLEVPRNMWKQCYEGGEVVRYTGP